MVQDRSSPDQAIHHPGKPSTSMMARSTHARMVQSNTVPYCIALALALALALDLARV